MTGKCDFCENPLPGGCFHVHGEYRECPLGKRTDPEWVVGMAVWKDLTDRRGVKNELEQCAPDIQAEIIETIGRKAIAAYKGILQSAEEAPRG